MIKGLVENECAGQNPLMKLATHFTASADTKLLSQQHQQQQQQQPSQLFNPDLLVAEYLSLDSKQAGRAASAQHQYHQHRPGVAQLAPRSFHMETLFKELKQIENTPQAISTTTTTANNNGLNKVIGSGLNSLNVVSTGGGSESMTSDWSDEYWSSMPSTINHQKTSVAAAAAPGVKAAVVMPPVIVDSSAFKWSADYLSQNESTIFDEAWENLFLKNTVNSSGNVSTTTGATTASKSDITLAESNNKLNEEMMKTANELLDSMQDSRFSETEFLSFVRNLSVNAAAINSEKTKSGTGATVTTESDSTSPVDLATEWVNEFQQAAAASSSSKTLVDEGDQSYWTDLQQEWNEIAYSNPDHPWLDEYQKVFDTYKTYEFDKENPLLLRGGHEKAEHAFDEGLERLRQHDIVNAVLLFEVAVQRDPAHMLAWQYLGTTQVENEQDAQAIRALRKCLELKPDNLTALSTLATSYTNENMQRLAFDSLIKWLKHHPGYSHLLRNDQQAARLLQSSDLMNQVEATSPFYMASLNIVDVSDFLDLQEVFLKAVRGESNSTSSGSTVDPDLQCCLGVLFHLSGEYDKAADCFKTALQVKPTDHLLWNKLGATFANNNRNEEAIDAYYQALKLCPGFVRARYNLGIGCMNLGAYKESVEHFLTALVQQSQATLPETSSNGATSVQQTSSTKIQQMSETIWSTMRLALSFLNRSDLYSACLTKDLDKLRVEFKI